MCWLPLLLVVTRSILTASGDSSWVRSGAMTGQELNTRPIPSTWDVGGLGLGGFGVSNMLPYRPTGVMSGQREVGFPGQSELTFTSQELNRRHIESDNDWYDGREDRDYYSTWVDGSQTDRDIDWPTREPAQKNVWYRSQNSWQQDD